MKETTIKVIILEPERKPQVREIENTLSVLQEIVGGYIEVVRMDGYDIIINEEGKLLGLPSNFLIHNGADYIAGTAIFVGVDYNEGEFKSLSEPHIDFIKLVFPRKRPLDSINIYGQLERGVLNSLDELIERSYRK